MRRKVFSPEFIAGILIGLTALILAAVFLLQARNVKILYGSSLRKAVYELNDAVSATEEIVASGNASALYRNAADILGAKTAGEVHPEIEKYLENTADALFLYGEALTEGGYSESGLKLLADDCTGNAEVLKLLVQHAIEKLYSPNTLSMDKAYYKAISPTQKVYKEITLLAEHAAEQQ